MDSLLSIVITVVSGVLVYIAGEILQTIWLTPLQKFKDLKNEVAITLTFYARVYTNIVDAANVDMTTREEYGDVSDKIRTLSCELKGYIETLSWFKIGIPSKKNLIKASETLMGLSNSLFSPYNTKPTTEENVRNKAMVNEVFSLLGMYGFKKNNTKKRKRK